MREISRRITTESSTTSVLIGSPGCVERGFEGVEAAGGGAVG
jgi:hypothetical protein